MAARLPSGFPALGSVEDILREAAETPYKVIRSDAGSEYWTLMQLIPRSVLPESERELRLFTVGLLAALLVVRSRLRCGCRGCWPRQPRASSRGCARWKKAIAACLKISRVQEYLVLTANFNRMVQRLDEMIDRLDREHRKRREVEME